MIPEHVTLYKNMHVEIYNAYCNIQDVIMCTNIRVVVVFFYDYIVTIDEFHKLNLHIMPSPL